VSAAGGAVKGIANGIDVERLEFEILGTSYWIEILKDPPSRVWNELKTVKTGESKFDEDTRVLETALQDWDLGIEIKREAIEDLQEPVRLAMVHVTVEYYRGLQKQYSDILAHIYRPGGDGPTDPTSGSVTASGSPGRSKASRRTR